MKTSTAWRRFALSVRPRDIEAASTLLHIATGAPVTVEQRGDDAPATSRATVAAYLPERTSNGVSALLARALRSASRTGALRGATVKPPVVVRDEDWAESWKRFYKPFRIAPAWFVAPSWEAGFVAPAGTRTILLDPGMAFGTGQHPTTRAALQLLVTHVRRGAPMVDVGCGSGILGIAGAMCGSRVFACDVDPIAIAATRSNFKMNRVQPASVRRADGIPATFPKAPVVVANITADALARLAPSLAAHVSRTGILISAGIHRAGRGAVLDAFAAQGLRRVTERRSGEWIAFVHERA